MSDEPQERRGRRKKAKPTPEVPPGFREIFAGAREDELAGRLRRYMEIEYGSPYAYLYWMLTLAATADRETVRFDANRYLTELFHGKAPQELIVKRGTEVANAAPAELAPPERVPEVLRLLARVGALPSGIGNGEPE